MRETGLVGLGAEAKKEVEAVGDGLLPPPRVPPGYRLSPDAGRWGSEAETAETIEQRVHPGWA